MSKEFLLEKSKSNELAVAHLLNHESLTAPIVHCCYYSCFQKILYILETRGKDYDTLDKMRGPKSGMHTYCRDLVVDILRKTDRKKAKDFESKMKNLRSFRNEADYKKIQITSSKVNDAKRYMETIHRYLKPLT